MESFGISIIICVHNGASRIIPTLKALSEQNIPSGISCELLIIDNGSTDSTGKVAFNYWNSIGSPFPLTILIEPKTGKANALVLGYNEAKYELLLLCDDDNWLQPDYCRTVFDLFTTYPEIGLLGGYGKALFETGEKPEWFDTWEQCYFCGKHHTRNGFLAPGNFSIWGAGSVLRKTMWKFLRSNGFRFYNSTSGGKAITEDAELSIIITFTGHQLYFDDRLWFIHDLRGGRITWENLLAQQILNGKANAILYMYQLACDHISNSFSSVNYLFVKKILGLVWHLCTSVLKWQNRPKWIFFYHILKELTTNTKKYKKLSLESIDWIKKIRGTFPLATETGLAGLKNLYANHIDEK